MALCAADPEFDDLLADEHPDTGDTHSDNSGNDDCYTARNQYPDTIAHTYPGPDFYLLDREWKRT